MGGVEVRDDRARGVLEAFEGGELVGHIVYFTLDAPEAALVPVHTEVASAHEGKGIAGSLATELYALAAREGVAVAPLCPYVVKWAERHPEQAPVASEELMRAALDKVRKDPSTW
ncbi:GNAT family N-acetyltransferase [Streptomyces silaceus]|uniref:GNAT family N-acetyltransferase n=1 Tax=Streptomyces silaceus TaxID=545123 RepID=UPI0006EB7D55|nr:GNAT family N-acetyltransferase [Streptomyces silaceus]